MIEIIDIDSSQYASISLEMLRNGSYLEVIHRYKDYLDKPPFLFWINTVSYRIFGLNEFSFRFPSFLFTILGVFSTYKLGRLLYTYRVGIISAIVLSTCQAWFLFNHDVRTDTILAGAVIFSVWQITLFLRKNKLLHLFLGFTGVAIAMMEKGPIGLIVPVLAFGSEFFFKREWKNIFRWEWLLALLILAVLLAPMTYGLYLQFGWEGPEFFYWTQSFGRITGENVWKDDSTVFYFTHTFLWAFWPWMFLAYFGVGQKFWNIFKDKFRSIKETEVITLGGFVLTFISLSTSNFKLPHYIFVVFPLAAIITAHTIDRILSNLPENPKLFKIFFQVQFWSCVILMIFALLLNIGSFPMTNLLFWIFPIVMFGLAFYFARKEFSSLYRLVLPSVFTLIGLNFLMNINFYPQLNQYHTGTVIAEYVKKQDLPNDKIYFYDVGSHAFDFYTRFHHLDIKGGELSEVLEQEGDIWIYTNTVGEKYVEENNIEVLEKVKFDHFHVTSLKIPFLIPSTREKYIDKRMLIHIKS
ncbi:ArnT family glycosyltransferase [Flexithrix dorotheae]|uniref:ArnT family glycosyltransferase n=1 Tax=Flexithrix dorotheae TaxID=70993 RepID=UPI0012F8E34E|nr:glycosyltransferase family 39 protein [Flexithrix dorotheae]